jgi:hypothetical protein
VKDWITLALVAAAFTLMGVMGGVAITPEPSVIVSDTKPQPTVTKTVTVRVTERASRSQVSRPPVSDTEATGKYQEYARARVESSEWPCLRELVQRESSWNPTAVTGSHYGLFQMRGLKHSTGWKRQVERGLGYIDHRYGGDVCVALSHSNKTGWY